MENARQEFWGDIQRDLQVQNTAYYLANRAAEDVLNQSGRKLHKPIFSHPQVGTYTPHSDISFESKTASDQYLEVDTFTYAAEDLDDTEKAQTPYDLPAHSLKTIRAGLLNGVEQKFLSQITSAGQSIAGAPVLVSSANVLDILEEAEGKLGAVDAPFETSMRAVVLGPRTVAKLRRTKSDRETRIGDSVLENGVVGPWQGWTVVQNNNLPYSAVLTMATQPTEGDTVTIAGVTFTFKATPASAGDVDLGTDVDVSRANLAAAINDSGTAGTTYIQLGKNDNLTIRRKRNITATNDNDADTLTIAGYGDISVSETLTNAANVWGSQTVGSVFMIRGAIDLVVQLNELEMIRKEKGFADLVKGLIGVGAKVFDDGAQYMVYMQQDASGF
jgi:hypothetical protein